MTREDLGALRSLADSFLNHCLTKAIGDIRSSLRACGVFDDEPTDHPLFSEREREILRLLISDDPFGSWPGWVSTKALEYFVCFTSSTVKGLHEPSQFPVVSVFVPPGSVNVKVDLGWVEVNGYVDRNVVPARAFVVEWERRDGGRHDEPWTEEQWLTVKNAIEAAA